MERYGFVAYQDLPGMCVERCLQPLVARSLPRGERAGILWFVVSDRLVRKRRRYRITNWDAGPEIQS